QAGRDFQVIAAAAFFIDTCDGVSGACRESLRGRDVGRPPTAAARFLNDQRIAVRIIASGVQEQPRAVIARQVEQEVPGYWRNHRTTDAGTVAIMAVVREDRA